MTKFTPGPKQVARDIIAPQEAIKSLITDRIVREIVTMITKRIKLVAPRISSRSTTFSAASPMGILALQGVLIVAG